MSLFHLMHFQENYLTAYQNKRKLQISSNFKRYITEKRAITQKLNKTREKINISWNCLSRPISFIVQYLEEKIMDLEQEIYMRSK